MSLCHSVKDSRNPYLTGGSVSRGTSKPLFINPLSSAKIRLFFEIPVISFYFIRWFFRFVMLVFSLVMSGFSRVLRVFSSCLNALCAAGFFLPLQV